MMKKIKIIFILIWYAIGVHGFIHWWTLDSNFTNKQIPLAIAAGMTGPVVHGIGWVIHGDPTNVLIPKK